MKITKEKCISLLCSLSNWLDYLVMAIRRNNTTLNIENEVATLLSIETRLNTMEGSTPEALSVRGQSININKSKPSSGRSRSRGKSRSRSTSLVQSMR